MPWIVSGEVAVRDQPVFWMLASISDDLEVAHDDLSCNLTSGQPHR